MTNRCTVNTDSDLFKSAMNVISLNTKGLRKREYRLNLNRIKTGAGAALSTDRLWELSTQGNYL